MMYIFDLDGTLLNSLHAWENIGNKYLMSIGKQTKDTLDKEVEHMSLYEASEYIRKEFDIEDSTQNIAQKIKNLIVEQYAYNISLNEGVYDFIKSSKERMIVFTASDDNLGKLALKNNGILDCFEAVESCQTIGFNKTDKRCYESIQDKYNVSKKDCIVFEDAYYAIKTAKEAGFKVIGILHDVNQKDWDKIKECADKTYTSFKEIK